MLRKAESRDRNSRILQKFDQNFKVVRPPQKKDMKHNSMRVICKKPSYHERNENLAKPEITQISLKKDSCFTRMDSEPEAMVLSTFMQESSIQKLQESQNSKNIILENFQRIILLSMENNRLNLKIDGMVEHNKLKISEILKKNSENLNQLKIQNSTLVQQKITLTQQNKHQETIIQNLQKEIKANYNTEEIEYKLETLASENNRLIQTSTNIQIEYKKLLAEINKKNIILEETEKKMKVLKKSKQEFTENFNILVKDNERLYKKHTDYDRETEKMRRKLENSENRFSALNSKYKEEVSFLKDQAAKYEAMVDKEKGYKSKMISRIKEFEDVVIKLQKENSKLHDKLTVHITEITTVKSRSTQENQKIKNQVDDLESKIKMLASENERLSSMLNNSRRDNREMHNLELGFKEAEDKLRLLAKENERLQILLKDKSFKKDKLEEAKKILEVELENLKEDAKLSKKNLKKVNSQFAENQTSYQQQIMSLKKNYEQKISGLEEENSRILNKCQDVVKEIEILRVDNCNFDEKSKLFKDEISQLLHKLNLKEISVVDKQKRIKELEKNKIALKQKLESSEVNLFEVRQEQEVVVGKLSGAEDDLQRKNLLILKLKKKIEHLSSDAEQDLEKNI